MPALRSKREVGRRRRRRRGGGTEEADRQPASVQPAPPSAGPIAGCCGHGRLRASQRPEESPDERPTARSVPRRTVFAQLRATPPGERRRGPSAGTGGRPTDRPTNQLSRRSKTDPEPDMDGGRASVRNVRSKCRCSHVLQFTFRRAVCCVLHRPPSQVIHCTVLSLAHSVSIVARAHWSRTSSWVLRRRQLTRPTRGVLLGQFEASLSRATAEAGQTGPRSRESNVECAADAWAAPGRLSPEVRASVDNRLVLPRPVPAAAKSA